MFARVKGFTDHQLLEDVDLEKDLVQVRTGETSYLLLSLKLGATRNWADSCLGMGYICSGKLGCMVLRMGLFMSDFLLLRRKSSFMD